MPGSSHRVHARTGGCSSLPAERGSKLAADSPIDLAMREELGNVGLAGRAGLDHFALSQWPPRVGCPVFHVALALHVEHPKLVVNLERALN